MTIDRLGGTTPLGFQQIGPAEQAKQTAATLLGAKQFDPGAGGHAPGATFGMPAPSNQDNVDLVATLEAVKTKMDDMQLQGSEQDVRNVTTLKKEASDKRMKQIEEAANKTEKAGKSGTIGKIFGWIAAAAMAIAGAILIATGVGAAAGVGLLVGGVAMMATMALQQTGGMDKLLDAMTSGLVKLGMDPKAARAFSTAVVGAVILAASVAAGVAAGPAVGAMLAASFLPTVLSADNLEKMGVDKDKAPWISFGISVGLGLAAAGVGIGVGVAGAMGKGAELAGSLGSRIATIGSSAAESIATKLGVQLGQVIKVGQIASYVALGIQAAATVGSGSAGVAAGVQQKEAADAQANAKELQADFVKLQKKMQEMSDEIGEIVKRMKEGVDVVMDVLKQDNVAKMKVATV